MLSGKRKARLLYPCIIQPSIHLPGMLAGLTVEVFLVNKISWIVAVVLIGMHLYFS
jgi:hypothetical protein